MVILPSSKERQLTFLQKVKLIQLGKRSSVKRERERKREKESERERERERKS